MVLKTYWFGRGWDHNGLVGGPPRSCVKALLIKYRVSGRPPAQAGSEMSQPLWAEITRGERGYCLSQVSYIRELLQLYGCEGQAPSSNLQMDGTGAGGCSGTKPG